MFTCQCEGFLVGQSNGVLLKEVAAIRRCTLIIDFTVFKNKQMEILN